MGLDAKLGDHGGSADRWMAVGRSGLPDAEEAALEAAGQALRPGACLLMLFCSESYDLRAVVAAINRESGGVPMIGCSTAGEIATSGPGESGLVVTALGGFSISTGYAPGASKDLRAAGETLAAKVEDISAAPHKVLILLTDGLAGDQQEIVRGAYGVVGASVPVVGGCAGDDLKMRSTYQIYDDLVLQDAVVGAAVGSSSPLGIGVRHGWRKVSEPMLVTRSGGNRVFTLDERPALDTYLDRLNAPPEARSDPFSFTRFAMWRPLGLIRRLGEPYARFVAGADFADRSLRCIAEVPSGALVWVMEGDETSVLEATDEACAEALEALGPASPIGLLAFDCISRRGVLGEDGIKAEVERIASGSRGVPVGGFYSYGEFARVRGMKGFHNQTLVVLALS